MKILIEIEGGYLRGVWCEQPEGVDVVVRNMDDVNTGYPDPLDEDPSLQTLRTGHFAVY